MSLNQDPLSIQTPRAMCRLCLRPQRTCICRWVAPIDHATDVLILQHPLEEHAAKGSARLLHLSLARSRLVTGEVFDEAALRALLFEPFHVQTHVQTAVQTAAPQKIIPLLLYPETQPGAAGGNPSFDRASRDASAQLRLVVLDGTWRKSRKMLYLNPLLQTLPRLPLSNLPPSRYLIRKAHKPDQLSTLEAACLALTQLEKNGKNGEQKYAPLLHAFDGFVAQQARYVSMDSTPACTPPEVA